jgi:hypothetical protein
MTNYEYIKSLTVEQMAEWLDKIFNQDRDDWDSIGCYNCINYGTHHCNERECGDCEYYGGLKQWLKREVI